MPTNKYYVSAIAAFVIWGFFSLVLKPLHLYRSLDILFYRVFYAVTLLLVINLVFRRKALKNDLKVFKSFNKKARRSTIILTIVSGFLLVTNWFLFIYAVNHVSLKSASFAYLLCPILTTILAFFILKEQLSKWQWVAVAVSLASCAILSIGSQKDLIYSFFIALSFAFYLIIQRKNNQFDKFVMLTIQMVIVAAVLIPFFPKYSGSIPQESLFYIMLTFIVVLFTIIPMFLQLYALKGMKSSAVGILMYINPMINFLLAVFYFKEEIDDIQIVSYGLILLSVVIFNEKYLFRRNTIAIEKP
ncbi:EamA family transporter [Flavobacterium noncentrifugens]|nr:EamA family transporter [Flavobacterium noncentrifugens]